MMLDSYVGIGSRATSWVGETFTDVFSDKSMPGRHLTIHSSGGNTFGITLNNEPCSRGAVHCVGSSTPLMNTKPFFNIKCGNASYVGHDRYFFSPQRSSESDPLRSYVCDGQDGIRPQWTLIGHFMDSCNSVMNAYYDPSFCTQFSEVRLSTISFELLCLNYGTIQYFSFFPTIRLFHVDAFWQSKFQANPATFSDTLGESKQLAIRTTKSTTFSDTFK